MTDWKSLDGQTLLDTLQSQCTEEGISDIHCSPQKDEVRIEVRRLGMLDPVTIIDHKQYADLLRRVKFQSKLLLNITNLPQDGQYGFKHKDREVRVRVATLPTKFGEALTLRLLDPNRGLQPLESLGFTKDIETTLADIVQKPYGMLLVTGPTGSGKTTTLYALLQTLVGTKRNIITLEDPIEYELEGIIQSQIDHEHDYTFASGLRSILRHDPDVILVGEIRDLETAQTAIDAALTGHFVLSTLHTNTAIEAVTRLLSMGVSPYTFAPALQGVLAQRLVRTLDPELQKTGAEFDPTDNASYTGRMVLPELVAMNNDLREMILMNETASEIEAKAREHGFLSMVERGKDLIESGLTTELEINRVIV